MFTLQTVCRAVAPVTKQYSMTGLEKQIEAARKHHDKFEKNINMYHARADKRISELASKGFSVSRDDFQVEKAQFGYEVRVSDQVKSEMPSSLYCPIVSAILSEHENVIHLQRNERKLDELLSKQKQKEEEGQAKAKQYNNDLEKAFAKILKPFYNKWWAERREWCYNHYTFIHTYLPEAKEQRGVVQKMIGEELQLHGATTHYRNLLAKKQRYIAIIADPAGRYKTVAEYTKRMHEEFDDYYGVCMRRLTERCSKFNVDEEKMKVRCPNISNKGFELEIFDGKNRMVHARVILAAVYSETISEHLRYIVTERQLLDNPLTFKIADKNCQDAGLGESKGRKI